MYKNIITISAAQIQDLNISARDKYDWVDNTLTNKSSYILPTKTRMPLKETDYFNVMPCALPDENVLGLKVVTRNENRRLAGLSNIDGDILLYSYDNFLPIALIDGAYITTVRTAAVAVHTMLNFAKKYDIIAMVGLGNIGTEIGNILFELVKDIHLTVKLYRYKNHAEKFIERFRMFDNINFVVCDTYEDLMSDSDVVFSSITYIADDFCNPSVFKKETTVIPVHLRGFKECDKEFDTVITSDLISIQKFENYKHIKNLLYIDDIFKNKNFINNGRTIIYNLGLAIYDLYFASQIYKKVKESLMTSSKDSTDELNKSSNIAICDKFTHMGGGKMQ